ncbi:MAG TPA: DNA-directed RNA polymerase subunit beta', partial [bacterium]|nr:DNA-directed RNA polymerase subunit beta' [bacterium]
MKSKHYKQATDFDAIKLMLASPDQILDWSYGEVTKAETINYRTFKAEPDGLFCEKIFGPTKNFECYCGKYKKVRFKGIICDKCGVEVTTKDVRRERMAHINLAVPVSHVWFAYGVPNKLSIILDMPHKKILAVIYYSRYMVTEIEEDKRKEMSKKLVELREESIAQLDAQMKEEIDELEAEYEEKVKELKSNKDMKKGKLDFALSTMEHEHNQEIAKLRHGYATMEAEEDAIFDNFAEIINKLQLGSVITEDEYLDLR